MLVNLLAFTSAYFSELRVFNGLRPIQIRKSPSHPELAPPVVRNLFQPAFLSLFLARRREAWLNPASAEWYSTDSGFCKEIARLPTNLNGLLAR
jgi:hypothetical protein